ncbi:hypothetical protein QVD17_28437 [Tagetes erecta]|uniref:Uncharacterized protein n=1 Tax=Tagetes erecta TaxID=13708 RepID=A0AAD8KCU4_TARER|nr:hypothetical protein QVD17_28437 [Tagetes erecta]
MYRYLKRCDYDAWHYAIMASRDKAILSVTLRSDVHNLVLDVTGMRDIRKTGMRDVYSSVLVVIGTRDTLDCNLSIQIMKCTSIHRNSVMVAAQKTLDHMNSMGWFPPPPT